MDKVFYLDRIILTNMRRLYYLDCVGFYLSHSLAKIPYGGITDTRKQDNTGTLFLFSFKE